MPKAKRRLHKRELKITGAGALRAGGDTLSTHLSIAGEKGDTPVKITRAAAQILYHSLAQHFVGVTPLTPAAARKDGAR